MDIKENFSIFRLIEFPHILTLMNVVCGTISIMFSISKEYGFACGFLLAAVVFDLLDGKIAKYMKKVSSFGKELDSLCDIVSFGLAPAMLAFQNTKNLGEGWIFAVIIYVIFIAAGVLRLARFNIKDLDHFEGLPITTNGVIVPVFYFLGLTSWYPFIFLVSAILMISAFKLKRF